MRYHLPEPDKKRISFIQSLGKSILKKLAIPFTSQFLYHSVVQAYFNTLEGQHFLVETNPEERMITDKDDPTNLVIVLLEVLKKYGIKNEVTESPVSAEGSTSVIVLKKKEGEQPYQHSAGQLEEARDGFFFIHFPGDKTPVLYRPDEMFTESCVILQPTAAAGEPGYPLNRRRSIAKKILPAGLIIFSAIFAGMAFYQAAIHYPILYWLPQAIIPTAGIFISYYLFRIEKDRTYASSLIKKLCSAGGEQQGCHKVILSKGSKIFGIISLTDACTIYFCSLFIFILTGFFFQHFPEQEPVLFWCSAISLPVTFYSLFYQFKVLRSFCILCVSIVVLLWLQFVLFLFFNHPVHLFAIYAGPVIQFILTLALVSGVYFLFLDYLDFQKKEFSLRQTDHAFKNNPVVFNALTESQTLFEMPLFPGVLILGNSSSPVKITAVLSGSCAPCAQKLTELCQLAEWFNHEIYIVIHLRPDEATRKLSTVFHGLNSSGKFSEAKDLLADWYRFLSVQKNKNVAPAEIVRDFLSGYDYSSVMTEETALASAAYTDWHKVNPVPHTPFLLYNNKPLPAIYYDKEILINHIEQTWN